MTPNFSIENLKYFHNKFYSYFLLLLFFNIIFCVNKILKIQENTLNFLALLIGDFGQVTINRYYILLEWINF